MRVYIKNMVCDRCRRAVQQAFQDAGLPPLSVELGEVELAVPASEADLHQVEERLKALGFAFINTRQGRQIEEIKVSLQNIVQGRTALPNLTLSHYLAEALHHDYSALSKLFSETEGTTIEQYYIRLKIEKVKELIVYDELTLTEIADRLGYSSVAHLSAQFKKLSGLTPSFYKALPRHPRTGIEQL